MILDEIKATPYPYSVSTEQHGTATQVIGEFNAKDGSEIVIELYIASDKSGILAFDRDGSVDMTHTGDQFKILFTILDFIEKILPKVIKKGLLTELEFSADTSEPSRVKLYKNRLAPVISQLLGPSWTGPSIKQDFAGETFSWKMKE